MTQNQYDSLYILLKRNSDKLNDVLVSLNKLTESIEKLNSKTLVISDVDNKIEQLKIDIESLKDEEEM